MYAYTPRTMVFTETEDYTLHVCQLMWISMRYYMTLKGSRYKTYFYAKEIQLVGEQLVYL
jgi:hypothetical protein